MAEEKKNIPKLRFREFTGDNANAWELRKFRDILLFSVPTNNLSRSKLNYENGNVKNIHYGDILVKFDSVVCATNSQIPFINEGEIEVKDSYLLRDGDIVIADTAEDESTGKSVEIYGTLGMKLVSGLHTIVARPKLSFASFYLGYYMNSWSYHKQLLPLMQGIKVLSLSKANIAKTKISYPKELVEQQKIGSFFKHLDELITLHQRMLDEYKTLKKTMLSKMFPKNGEKYPELRFSGFTDAWELRKLGDIGKITAGGDIDKNEITSSGKYPVIANGLTNDGVIGYYNNYYRISGPAVTVTGRGDIGLAKAREFDFTPVVRLLAIETKQNVIFLENSINRLQFFVESTGVPQLTAVQLRAYKIYLTTTIEQQKIGSFFRHLDELITLHQRELDLLKTLKKTMLQQMFV